MKQALKKLKGCSFQTDVGEVTLSQFFREDNCEYDQLYFSTQLDNLTCKIYDLQTDSSLERFHQQQSIYLKSSFEQFAQHLIIEEIKIRKINYGVLLLKVSRKDMLKEIANSFTMHDWLALIEMVLGFLTKLKSEKLVFLNFTPWSFTRNNEGEFKLIDVQYLSPQGTYQQLSESQYQLLDICQKQYHYRCPELLDQYGKNKIDYSSDLFSFGIVLYELMYHQYPFESKLAQTNSNYKSVGEDHFMSQFIAQLLKPFSERASLETLKGMVQAERKKIPKEPTTKNMSSGSTTQSKSSNIFSGLTQMFSKLTTQTQSWYLNFTQNDEQRPQQKYLSFIINKLYKKQTKFQKLQIVMTKYIKESDLESKENQLLKTQLLMLQLFRRGPKMMNCSWQTVIEVLEERVSSNPVLAELLSFIKQKIVINDKVKTLMRGNFYIQNFAKFKQVNFQILQTLLSHLNWTIDSINSKLVFVKKDKPVLEYAREIYCDQILDLISMLIFSVLSIRKDCELQLRKDSIQKLAQMQKKLNNMLRKISNLSNHVNAHAIYSLEGEFFYYQQEIVLREKPFYTTLQYFYKQCREYKGLSIPQNYSLTYSSGDQKEFLSSENNRADKSEGTKQKTYFQEQDSDQDANNSSFKQIQSPSPEKSRQKRESFLEMLKGQKPKKQPLSKNDNFLPLKAVKSKQEEPKKTVTFDQFFNLEANKPPQPKNNAFQFNFQPKNVPQPQKKQIKPANDFSFFQAFADQPISAPKPPEGKNKNAANVNFFQNFGSNPKEDKNQKQKNPTLGSSNSQKIIQQNILSYDWLKNSSLQPYQATKLTIEPAVLNDILSGLKLKELKESITNNQQIIIDFKKLKINKVIGSGSAGEVYFGQYAHENLAIKKVKTKQNPNALKQFQRQLLTYIKIKRNPYLVSLVGLSKADENYYLLTQFCNSGSLFDLLHKRANTTPLSWKQRILIATQIAKGMLSLHEMKPPIIHRDLKSLNVFVIQNNNTFTAKVADFGLSRSPQSQMMTMYLGTLHWMAPELLDNRQYSIKVDVYSYAVVLWEICARKTPYNQLSTPMAIIKHVTMDKKRPNLSVIPPDCPPQLIEIMKLCWAHEPNERPSFGQIIQSLSKINVFI